MMPNWKSLIPIACVVALCLIVPLMYSSLTGEAKAEPPGGQAAKGIDIGQVGGAGLVAVAEPNDTCADAEEIKPLIALPPPGSGPPSPPDSYTVNVNDRKFYNGNSVDDWYLYTTHDLDCDVTLTVKVTSDKPQIELEIYEHCWQWPIDTTMYEEIMVWGQDQPEIQILSGLEKSVSVSNASPNTGYLIHVNYLSPPEDAGPITYDLKVTEECTQVPY
jgi:hypothetical protein